MIPTAQIGKHSIPVNAIIAVIAVRYFFFWTRYDVYLVGGAVVRLTPDEKTALDDAIELHKKTLSIYQGMERSMQHQRRK